MPSFDIVSEVDKHELANAIDQANREIGNRYDFKGSDAGVRQDEFEMTLEAESEFQVEQVLEILRTRLAKRSIDLTALELGSVTLTGNRARQICKVRTGIDADLGRKIIRLIKDSKIKVQAAMQQEQVRVTGKKRDDLQEVIALLRGQSLGLPLQFINFRD
ncbi:MAG: YajQ family cyclic di-GMP-binding protein [Gammaproteobacteria bacterium]|nr:YajQ family cyclic di-GMP-binding protein [Gammaproteobacteria bacterium]